MAILLFEKHDDRDPYGIFGLVLIIEQWRLFTKYSHGDPNSYLSLGEYWEDEPTIRN